MALDWPQCSIERHAFYWNTEEYKEEEQTKNSLEENYRMETAECLKKLERSKDKTKCKSLVKVLCGTLEKRENNNNINGRLGRDQSSPRKLVNRFPVLIILDLHLSQDKRQSFCDKPTI